MTPRPFMKERDSHPAPPSRRRRTHTPPRPFKRRGVHTPSHLHNGRGIHTPRKASRFLHGTRSSSIGASCCRCCSSLCAHQCPVGGGVSPTPTIPTRVSVSPHSHSHTHSHQHDAVGGAVFVPRCRPAHACAVNMVALIAELAAVVELFAHHLVHTHTVDAPPL